MIDRPPRPVADVVAPSAAEALRIQRGPTLWASTLLVIHEAGEAAVPVLIGVIVDRAIARSDAAAMAGWLAVLLVAFVVLSLSYRFGARANRLLALRATHRLRRGVAEKVLGPRGDIGGQLPGTVLNIATSDTTRAGLATSAIASGLSSAATVLVVGAALLASSLVAGVVVIVFAPPVLVLLHLCSRVIERRSDEQQERAATSTAMATDLLDGLRVLKGIGAEQAASARYREVSREALDASLRAARADALFRAVSDALIGTFVVGVTLVAARQAAGGDISVGALIATVGLAQMVLDPLADVAGIGAALARTRASAKRVAAVLDAAPAPAGGTENLPPVNGALALEGLRAGTLDGVDLHVPAGQLLGVVALRAADARSLLDCLARRTDPAAGAVRLDGVVSTTVDPDSWRGAVVVSDHDAVLFEGSVEDNVADAAPARAPSVVTAAMAAATVDQVVEVLVDGAATDVGEHGRSLSGGQRQRAALARLLATEAPVVVAHDPTTAIDSVTEATIAQRLRTMRRGRTTLLVATSPTLLDVCDRVVVLDGGVVADGTHHSLQSLPAYREAVLT